MYRKTIQHEKENLSNGLISEELIYACLMTCVNITVRQSRQSGVARATCPD